MKNAIAIANAKKKRAQSTSHANGQSGTGSNHRSNNESKSSSTDQSDDVEHKAVAPSNQSAIRARLAALPKRRAEPTPRHESKTFLVHANLRQFYNALSKAEMQLRLDLFNVKTVAKLVDQHREDMAWRIPSEELQRQWQAMAEDVNRLFDKALEGERNKFSPSSLAVSLEAFCYSQAEVTYHLANRKLTHDMRRHQIQLMRSHQAWFEELDGELHAYGIRECQLVSLRLVQFKHFTDQTLVVQPNLTVIVGANNVGKTSILSAAQTFCSAVRLGSSTLLSEDAIEKGLFFEYGKTQTIEGTYLVKYDCKDRPLTRELSFRVSVQEDEMQGEETGRTEVFVLVQALDVCNQDYHCSPFLRQFFEVAAVEADEHYPWLLPFLPAPVYLDSKSTWYRGNLKAEFARRGLPIYEIQDPLNFEMQQIFPKFQLHFLKRHTGDIQLTDGINPSSSSEPCSEAVCHLLCLMSTILYAPSHSVLLIDEPDAHVFAAAQRTLIMRFRELLRNDAPLKRRFRQMIITTHSGDMMQHANLGELVQVFPANSVGAGPSLHPLASACDLVTLMANLGAGHLRNGDLVRLAVQRRVIILENKLDWRWIEALIRFRRPQLVPLLSSILLLSKGGHWTDAEVTALVRSSNLLLPEAQRNKAGVHALVITDSDLVWKRVLGSTRKQQQKATDLLAKEKSQVNFFVWPCRDWENELLINPEILCTLLTGNSPAHTSTPVVKLQDAFKRYLEMKKLSGFAEYFAHTIRDAAKKLYLDLTNPSVYGPSEHWINDADVDLRVQLYVQRHFGTADLGEYAGAIRGCIEAKVRDEMSRNGADTRRAAWLAERQLTGLDLLQLPTELTMWPDCLQNERLSNLLRWIDAKHFLYRFSSSTGWSKALSLSIPTPTLQRSDSIVLLEKLEATVPAAQFDLVFTLASSLWNSQWPKELDDLVNLLSAHCHAK